MTRHSALFLSHGSPMVLVDGSPAHHFLCRLGQEMPRPSVIVCITAHWLTEQVAVSMDPLPRTLHDFFGFPAELSGRMYNAPGHPVMAEQCARCLRDAGMPVILQARQGFDHGTWVPLTLLYPEADIPVVQISVQPRRDPFHHWQLGQALRSLRRHGALVVGSGSLTHNLHAYMRQGLPADAAPLPWVTAFADAVAVAVQDNQTDRLLEYRRTMPHAADNHPTDEHLLPLFVAMGAGGQGRVLHRSTAHGVIAMDAYAFGE